MITLLTVTSISYLDVGSYASNTCTINRRQIPVPENRYQFLEHLTCSLVPSFSGTSFR